MVQLMPLPLTVSCFSKSQIGFTFLVPAHPGSPVKRAVKRVCVSPGRGGGQYCTGVEVCCLLLLCSDCSELERNRLRVLEGLVFQGLESLLSLKLKRNSISTLRDGTFWGLGKILSLSVPRLSYVCLLTCFSKIQIGFTFLVLACPGSPGQRAVKQVCVLLVNCAVLYLVMLFGESGCVDTLNPVMLFLLLLLKMTVLPSVL